MLGIDWKRWTWLESWDWLDDGLIPLVGILMTVAWGYPLFGAFLQDPTSGIQNPGYTIWLCLAILVGGFLAGRLAIQNSMGIVIVIVGGLAAIFVSLLLTIPSDGQDIERWFVGMFRFLERAQETGEVFPVPLIVIVLATTLWSRGVRLASMDHQDAVGAFVTGIVALGGLLFISEVMSPGAGSGISGMLVSAFAPLFLISVPAAVFFSFLAPALGAWATTAGEVSIVVGILFLNLILPGGPGSQPLLGWLLFYLATGLTTLALMSVSSTLQEQERLTGIRLDVDRYWLVIMAVVILVVLLLGLVIGQIVAPESILWLFSLLRPVWVVVRQILLYVILLFAYLFFSLIEPLLGNLESRPSENPRTFLSPLRPEAIEDLARNPVEVPSIFYTILQVILILGLFAAIAIVFYLAVKKRQVHVLQRDQVVETRETVLSMELIQDQIGSLLEALRRRRQSTPFVELEPPLDPRQVVREMYQRILEQAMDLHSPRLKPQTPSNYGTTLIRLCSQATADIQVLTHIYTIARYGATPPTPDEVKTARQAFERINAALERGM